MTRKAAKRDDANEELQSMHDTRGVRWGGVDSEVKSVRWRGRIEPEELIRGRDNIAVKAFQNL